MSSCLDCVVEIDRNLLIDAYEAVDEEVGGVGSDALL